jgi:hypothetical protein
MHGILRKSLKPETHLRSHNIGTINLNNGPGSQIYFLSGSYLHIFMAIEEIPHHCTRKLQNIEIFLNFFESSMKLLGSDIYYGSRSADP